MSYYKISDGAYTFKGEGGGGYMKSGMTSIDTFKFTIRISVEFFIETVAFIIITKNYHFYSAF